MTEILKDTDRKWSSKRIIVLTSMLAMLGFSAIDVFTKYEVAGNIYRTLEWIIIAGLGVVGSEKFTAKYLKK